MDWNRLAANSLEGLTLARGQARSVLGAPVSETIALVAACYQVRKRYFGSRVRLNFLLNAKSGLCPEDCHYCSQSKVSSAPVEKYPWLSVEETLKTSERAVAAH